MVTIARRGTRKARQYAATFTLVESHGSRVLYTLTGPWCATQEDALCMLGNLLPEGLGTDATDAVDMALCGLYAADVA